MASHCDLQHVVSKVTGHGSPTVMSGRASELRCPHRYCSSSRSFKNCASLYGVRKIPQHVFAEKLVALNKFFATALPSRASLFRLHALARQRHDATSSASRVMRLHRKAVSVDNKPMLSLRDLVRDTQASCKDLSELRQACFGLRCLFRPTLIPEQRDQNNAVRKQCGTSAPAALLLQHLIVGDGQRGKQNAQEVRLGAEAISSHQPSGDQTDPQRLIGSSTKDQHERAHDAATVERPDRQQVQ